jgi:hypothetical protein
MVAARRSAERAIVDPAPEVAQREDNSAKPPVSRTRARSVARWCGANGVSSQPRLGRIASAPISRSRLTRRLLVTDTDAPYRWLPDCSRSMDGRHQSAFPSSSAPLALQRSCHVHPGWSASQPTTDTTPRVRRTRFPASVNGGARTRARSWSRSTLVPAQDAGTGRGG